VIAGTGKYTVIHSCSAAVPFGIIRTAGAHAVSFDLSQLRRGEEDGVAEAAEAGLGLLTGVMPAVPGPDAGTTRPAGPTGAVAPGDGSAEARQAAERVIRLWSRLGLPLETCPEQAVITPACGLAGASPSQARAALTRCREAGSMLAELIEETGEEG
jgi:hypothetical protein